MRFCIKLQPVQVFKIGKSDKIIRTVETLPINALLRNPSTLKAITIGEFAVQTHQHWKQWQSESLLYKTAHTENNYNRKVCCTNPSTLKAIAIGKFAVQTHPHWRQSQSESLLHKPIHTENNYNRKVAAQTHPPWKQLQSESCCTKPPTLKTITIGKSAAQTHPHWKQLKSESCCTKPIHTEGNHNRQRQKLEHGKCKGLILYARGGGGAAGGSGTDFFFFLPRSGERFMPPPWDFRGRKGAWLSSRQNSATILQVSIRPITRDICLVLQNWILYDAAYTRL